MVMDSRYASRRRPRWGTLLVVALLHLAVLAGLVRAFAPGFPSQLASRAVSLASVTITVPAEPRPQPDAERNAGAPGAQAHEAVAREVAAPAAPLPRPSPAPRAASSGVENVSGAGEQGAGTGAG